MKRERAENCKWLAKYRQGSQTDIGRAVPPDAEGHDSLVPFGGSTPEEALREGGHSLLLVSPSSPVNLWLTTL